MTESRLYSDRGAIHFGSFSLARASSASQLRRASELRRAVFLSRRGIVLDEELEARRDEHALVFLLSEGVTPLATARVGAFPSALSPLPKDLCLSTHADSELSRVACLRSAQTAHYSLLLLTLGAHFLLVHTCLRSYVAYAHPKLCPQHGRLGALDTGARCILPQRDDAYHILTGSYAETFRRGYALLGVADFRRSA